MAYDATLAARLRALLGDGEDVVERRMFGGIAFLVAGHMTVGVQDDLLMVRVGPEAYAKLLGEPHAREMNFTGRALRGFLYVEPPGTVGKGLARWVRRARAFTAALPAKSARATQARSARRLRGGKSSERPHVGRSARRSS